MLRAHFYEIQFGIAHGLGGLESDSREFLSKRPWRAQTNSPYLQLSALEGCFAGGGLIVAELSQQLLEVVCAMPCFHTLGER